MPVLTIIMCNPCTKVLSVSMVFPLVGLKRLLAVSSAGEAVIRATQELR